VPVTTLESDLSIEAITRVFETLNTSGQRLTPFEIVVAVLFAQNVNLRDDVEQLHETAEYYENMDGTGEILLQTIALLDNKSPKKATLPKIITSLNYHRFHMSAAVCLERAGEFLTKQFGMGLDGSTKLIPYDSMFAPLGIALIKIDELHPQASEVKIQLQRKLERWWVGSILSLRYSEAQPSKQQADTIQLLKWVEYGDEHEPIWLQAVKIPSLLDVTPTSAKGKFMVAMISRRSPDDPLNEVQVGGTGTAIQQTQSHHISPKAFCEDHIPDWNPNRFGHSVALNMMPVTKETNRKWNKMDPANQISDIRNRERSTTDTLELMAKFYINESAIEILEKPNKTMEDYIAFLSARESAFLIEMKQRWGFDSDSEYESDDEEQI